MKMSPMFFRTLTEAELEQIEPKWIHSKRRIVEPKRALSPLEVEERVCAALSCSMEDNLLISKIVS